MKLAACFCIVIGLFQSGPATAQADMGRLNPTAVTMLHDFGRCVAKRAPRKSADLLEMDYRTPQYRQALIQLAKEERRCLVGGQLRFGGVLLAGAVAEALLEITVKGPEVARLLVVDSSRPLIAARDDTETMALCTAFSAPEGTAALLRSAPASKAEEAELTALEPTFGNCLVKDAKVQLNRPSLRAILALAAWRIATGQQARLAS